MSETPAFVVVERFDDIELRRYSPYLVAEIDVTASDLRDGAEQGFGPLAEFIFGNNAPKVKIAMTAPVTAAATSPAKGQSIDMTAPVTATTGTGGLYTVRFSMPQQWTLETLPTPNNPDVRLLEVSGHDLLAMEFRGRDSRDRITQASQALVAFANEQQWNTVGDPLWAGYSAPYVPVPLRKWEMHLQLADASS